MRPRPLRRAAVWLHRWVGLAIAAFVLVTAAAGSLLAFYDEIEVGLVPELLVVAPPAGDAPMRDALALRDVVAAHQPQADVDGVELHRPPGRSQIFALSAKPGAPELPNDEVFVDPCRGAVIGERRHGDLRA